MISSRKPRLDIVIVNWNAGGYLSQCLTSVVNASANNYSLGRVLVVDNGSTDGSTDIPHFSIPRFRLFKNNTNLGFAAACNLGASLSKADFLLFLNPDVTLETDSLDIAVSYMHQRRDVRIGACGIKLRNPDGSIQLTCARIPRPINFLWHSIGFSSLNPSWFPDVKLHEWNHKTTGKVPHVIGAFYLISRSLFLGAGGFDERFFVYLEDLDLSARLRDLGWEIHYLSNASALHVGGGTSKNAKATALFYSLRSRLLFARKHYSPPGAALVFFSTLFIEPPARLARALIQWDRAGSVQSIEAYRLLYRCAKSCWSSNQFPSSKHSMADVTAKSDAD